MTDENGGPPKLTDDVSAILKDTELKVANVPGWWIRSRSGPHLQNARLRVARSGSSRMGNDLSGLNPVQRVTVSALGTIEAVPDSFRSGRPQGRAISPQGVAGRPVEFDHPHDDLVHHLLFQCCRVEVVLDPGEVGGVPPEEQCQAVTVPAGLEVVFAGRCR